MSLETPLAIRTRFGGKRWLLEIFESQEIKGPCIRHAVWLDQRANDWHWWCCCGASCQPHNDIVTVLTLARLHYDEIVTSAFHEQLPCSIEHQIALWRRKLGEPDNVVIEKTAHRVTASQQGVMSPGCNTLR